MAGAGGCWPRGRRRRIRARVEEVALGSVSEGGRGWGLVVETCRCHVIFECACVLSVRLAGCLELLELLVKVLVELEALDEGRVGLLELFPIEADEDGLDVVHELVDPREVEERSVHGLRVATCQQGEEFQGRRFLLPQK